MGDWATKEDLERTGLVVDFDRKAVDRVTLGGVSLPPARPVTDPPYGSVRGTIQLYVDGIVPLVERMINEFASVAEAARIASDAILRSMDSSPRARAKARAARFESQLPGLLDAAPKGARDGFGRRQGAGWDAWLRALADVRERVVCGDIRAQHASTTLVAAYAHWHVLMGTEWDACDAPVVDCNGTVIA